jgi:hypothetical protein
MLGILWYAGLVRQTMMTEVARVYETATPSSSVQAIAQESKLPGWGRRNLRDALNGIAKPTDGEVLELSRLGGVSLGDRSTSVVAAFGEPDGTGETADLPQVGEAWPDCTFCGYEEHGLLFLFGKGGKLEAIDLGFDTKNLRPLKQRNGSASLESEALAARVGKVGGMAVSSGGPINWDDSTGAMEGLKRLGLVHRVDLDRREVQISRLIWRMIDLDTKRGAVVHCARYFEAKTCYKHVKLLDAQSGEELGAYSAWSGIAIPDKW